MIVVYARARALLAYTLQRSPVSLWESQKHRFCDLRRNREELGLSKTTKARHSVSPENRFVQLINPENKPFTQAVRNAAKRRDWEAAKCAFEDAPSASPILYGAMMYAALVCNQLQEGISLYEEMYASSMQITVPMHVTAIQICAKLGRYAKAQEIWATQVSQKLSSDNAEPSYLAIIDAKACAGDVDGAVQLISEFATSGYGKPGVVHFGALMKACGKAKDQKTAKNCLQAMRKRSIPCDVPIYTSLIQAHSKADPTEILQIVHDMSQNTTSPDPYILEVLLQILLGSAQAASLKELQRRDPKRVAAAKQVCSDFVYANLEVKPSLAKLRKTLQDFPSL